MAGELVRLCWGNINGWLQVAVNFMEEKGVSAKRPRFSEAGELPRPEAASRASLHCTLGRAGAEPRQR